MLGELSGVDVVDHLPLVTALGSYGCVRSQSLVLVHKVFFLGESSAGQDSSVQYLLDLHRQEDQGSSFVGVCAIFANETLLLAVEVGCDALREVLKVVLFERRGVLGEAGLCV